MKLIVLFFCAVLSTISNAQSNATVELVRPILNAANLPFSDFVAVTISVQMPPLILPTSNTTSRPVDAVSNLFWQRLAALKLTRQHTKKEDLLKTFQSLCLLREWLLKQDSYANLLFSTFIEDAVVMATLSGLDEKFITIDEARQALRDLRAKVTPKAVVTTLEQVIPNSVALRDFKSATDERSSLVYLSWSLSQELKEQDDIRLPNLLGQERPASLVHYVGSSAIGRDTAEFVLDYVSKGGDLGLPYAQMTSDVKRLMPEIITIRDKTSGERLSPASLGLLMENVRKWRKVN